MFLDNSDDIEEMEKVEFLYRAFEIYSLVKKPNINIIGDSVLFEWDKYRALLVTKDKYAISSLDGGNFLYQFTSKEWCLEQLDVMGLIADR